MRPGGSPRHENDSVSPSQLLPRHFWSPNTFASSSERKRAPTLTSDVHGAAVPWERRAALRSLCVRRARRKRRNSVRYLETRFVGLCFQRLHAPQPWTHLVLQGQRRLAREMA